MKLSSKEWLDKAEEDFIVALRESKAVPVFHNIICYHCQQAAEKMLKAYLQELGIKFVKTHSLLKLIELIKEQDTFIVSFEKEFAFIDDLTPDIRYPGPGATQADAKMCISIVEKLKEQIKSKLK